MPMLKMPQCVAVLATIGLATAAGGQEAKPSLESLIQKFQSDAPVIEAEVRIDAWVEKAQKEGQRDEVVITILPEGETKLNADPGITVTPGELAAVDWGVPLPHRHQDFSITYFEPPATIRLPFEASANQPVDILVEYAYCLVDYQCFFGEESLRVDLPANADAS
jgi:hypothetical protein